MPLSIKKKGDEFCVVDPAGKQFGCHATKQGAVDQIGAIESNKAKSAIELAAAHRINLLAAELGTSVAEDQPPIVIVSDGTPEGTMLMLHGQPISAKRLSLYCSSDPDYPHCDLSITIEESSGDGLVVEKTLSLRKEPSEKGLR